MCEWVELSLNEGVRIGLRVRLGLMIDYAVFFYFFYT